MPENPPNSSTVTPPGSKEISPKLTVCVVTYNQQNYIAECLQSLVGQVTNFDFEVIVSDDCSTDSTSAIVAEFTKRYPSIVRHIRPDRNLGPYRNFTYVHGLAQGKYVAHVDGDDFALAGKLQAQVDILDAKPEVAFAAHEMRIIGSNQLFGADQNCPEYGSVYDLLNLGAYFAHSSVMYRRRECDDAFLPMECIDFYLHIERASRGAIYLDKRVFGCYRRHEAGISQQPAKTAINERFYELAFDRAGELGLDIDQVERARLKYRMKSAVARCLSRDYSGYRSRVKLDRDTWELATTRHKLLSLARHVPAVVHLYFLAKRWRSVWQ